MFLSTVQKKVNIAVKLDMLKPHLKWHTRKQRDLWTSIGDVYISFKGYFQKKLFKNTSPGDSLEGTPV